MLHILIKNKQHNKEAKKRKLLFSLHIEKGMLEYETIFWGDIMLKQREWSKDAINYEMCKACGGRCCKSSPCQYLPSDFESIEAIEDEIETNYAIIDLGKSRTSGLEFFFLRPRTNREDLTSDRLVLPEGNIYLATELSRSSYICKFFKHQQNYYYGIKYDDWDEVAIRNLSKTELEHIFRIKIALDEAKNKYQTMEQNIQGYLIAKEENGWGGCMLPEEKRPGGALYAIPNYNYNTGTVNCCCPEEMYSDNWDRLEHQEKLVKILSKKGLL